MSGISSAPLPCGSDDEAVPVGDRGDDATGRSQCQQLRLVSLNVDGCGHYGISPAMRMDDLLTMLLEEKPDVMLLQEVTAEMQVALQQRLPANEWRFYRRSHHSEEYFNLTVVKVAFCVSADRSTSYLFPQTSNGRHLVKVRPPGWAISNVHAESGSQRRVKAERLSQLEYMSSLHEEDDYRVNVLIGDFNVREGEDSCLRQEGWRDAWTLAKKRPLESWTWKHQNGQHIGRYDRVYIHNSRCASVQCMEYGVIRQTWGKLTDHVALRVVLQRVGGEPPSSAKAQVKVNADAVSHGASAATCRVQQRDAIGARGIESAASLRPDVPVVRIAKATASLAASWAGALACLEFLGDAGWKPERSEDGTPQRRTSIAWPDVPAEGGFRVQRITVNGKQRTATAQERKQQCDTYESFRCWVEGKCGVDESELRECLQEAANLHFNRRGFLDLPMLFRLQYGEHYLTVREHAVLLCRVRGLRSAL